MRLTRGPALLLVGMGVQIAESEDRDCETRRRGCNKTSADIRGVSSAH